MILSRAEPRLVDNLRGTVSDAATPILEFFSHPAASFASLVEEVDAALDVHKENARLEEQNAQLRKWQSIAAQISRENEELRRMLHVVPDPESSFITARVISDSGGPFVRTVLINAGAQDNVRKGQAVITSEGLTGRVVSTGRHSARILLLTDLNSRIPVVVESSRERAVLAGNNTPNPRLEFLAVDARVVVGSRIVTSGQGGIFPPGLPVGIVSSVGEERALVQPYVNWDRLEYITVLDYILPGFLPETKRAGRIGELK
ncbi:MAG: rod shape-determining protein MreC [Rhodospirillaceae bacterium]|nr:rod shape-determining protein MreC [Rhodospirillaceae bacterium]MBT3927368.1 rod shape-determining protein MreC [Rhodospirillaceae bacterium]MBT4426660.1 rod shape-determining protein MreC [Rhodospirillaceae bacterium]MBT5039054.1 rod shape-determining protein MreC [Rhodospirillaceae bacterium]MBT5676864.1 rod shape-determining protein MreC [Rhodospirillaceae bacterium]